MLKSRAPAVIDVFAGVGGLSLGAARAGFDVRAAVEIDAYAADSHHRNFPETVTLQQDVAALSGKQILTAANLKHGELVGLIGSPPCQGFSTIGRRNANDQRNGLFSDFFRLVRETRPTFFLAENVPGILQAPHAKLVARALELVESDYEIFGPITLAASDYGAPTSRKRVFFIGVSTSHPHRPCAESLACGRVEKFVYVRDALRGLTGIVEGNWRNNALGSTKLHKVQMTPYLKSMLDARPAGVGEPEVVRLLNESRIVLGHQGTVHSDAIKERYSLLGPGETDPITKSRRLQHDGFCPTLRAGTGRDKGAFQAVRPIHYRYARVITPREAARLQSFPDWFTFHSTKWHSFRQIGNSVPPILAEAVLRNIKAGLRL